jgi:ATP-dependent Clp protease protease subunit
MEDTMPMSELYFTFESDDSDNIYTKMYKDLSKKRILYINGGIDDGLIDMVAMPILFQNEIEKDIPEDKLKPITIYLNSYGGDIDPTLYTIGVIEGSRIPIHIKVLSIAASAGLYLALSCKHRIASENSIFLLHKGSIQLSGNTGDAEDTIAFYKEEVGSKFDDLILRRTKINPDELKKIRRNETYCLGREALEKYGFIDEII